MSFCEILKRLSEAKGFSAESLADAAGVSCEALCMWLEGSGVPSAEELEKLREVLGDGLPNEIYMLRQSPEEVAWLNKYFAKKHLLPTAMLTLIFTAAAVHQFILNQNSMAGFYTFCALLFLFLSLRNGKALRSAGQLTLAECRGKSYEYAVFEGFMNITVRFDGETRLQRKFFYDRITRVEPTGAHFLLFDGGVYYPIRLSALSRSSILHRVLEPQRVKSASKALARKAAAEAKAQPLPPRCSSGRFSGKNTSAALIIASIFSMFIPGILADTLGELRLPEMWICWLFLPIPLASVIWGIIMKVKGRTGCVKNILIGCICAGFILLSGSAALDADARRSADMEVLHAAEDALGIDMPDAEYISVQKMDIAYHSYCHMYYIANLDFSREGAELFEKKLDGHWMNYIPTDMLGLCPVLPDSDDTHFIVYNMDSGEFNRLPSADGSYRFMNVYYDSANNTMRIVEHQTEYRK
ncbi:MAG: helix-turn-helix transcriptional regulator [Oscillospiraceae bacterium]|nr:helix-turn-helix transcriptional regulator [Oscillospiraceae bacterium]